MSRLNLKRRLLFATIACVYMAVSYMLVSIAFTLDYTSFSSFFKASLDRVINYLGEFGQIFWFALFGSLIWAFACCLIAASVNSLFKAASVIAAISATIWSILLFYFAMDFENVFVLAVYSTDLSHLLVRAFPYFLTAINCSSLVIFAVGLAMYYKNAMISIISMLSSLVFMISAIAFLLSLTRSLPSMFFVVILPTGFFLLAVAIFRAALRTKA